ncbi:MAG: RNA polymerase sigma factor [Acidobacteriota bacterium]
MTHPDPKDPELQALVERAKQGDPGAYRELLDRYESRALGLARQLGLGREDAQDAVQDAFLKLFRYVHRFRSGESFTNWFYRIVVNASHDQLRRARRSRTVSLEGEAGRRAAQVVDPEGDPADPAEAGRLRERVLVALRCLSPQERAAYVLRDLQGLETLEVARALRVTRVTVRRHVSNARRKLRERLEGQFPELFRED